MILCTQLRGVPNPIDTGSRHIILHGSAFSAFAFGNPGFEFLQGFTRCDIAKVLFSFLFCGFHIDVTGQH